MLKNKNRVHNLAVVGTLVGSTLVSFTAISSSMKAGAQSLNPCPRIYYEEPFNSNRQVPQGCPANAATQQSTQPEAQSPMALPNRTVPFGGATPIQPPLPENRASAVTTVALRDGSFDVMVTNNTNTLVTYEVIGHTQRRYLQGGETVNLQNIPAPSTITFVRQDDGFVKVTPVSTTEPGLLSVSLNEDTSPSDNNGGTLRIQDTGQVYLN